MKDKVALITGAYGQLGKCIRKYVKEQGEINRTKFLFASHDEFDITDMSSMERYLYIHDDINIIVNCAAYTNVDGAQNDPVSAFTVNSKGVYNLVKLCEEHDIMLYHISTDHVYGGEGIYNEESECNPVNIYGQSKRDGELHIINSELKNWYIFRTSWLYSEFPGNFFTDIAELPDEAAADIICDEIGNPTYAGTLAYYMYELITYNICMPSGIYNVSGVGSCSKCDLAQHIKAHTYYITGTTAIVYPIMAKSIKNRAPRPKINIMDNSKFMQNSIFFMRPWRYQLTDCIYNYNNSRHERKLS